VLACRSLPFVESLETAMKSAPQESGYDGEVRFHDGTYWTWLTAYGGWKETVPAGFDEDAFPAEGGVGDAGAAGGAGPANGDEVG
jgi:hypothetical protein